jgi:pentatricopeptide repeat protein
METMHTTGDNSSSMSVLFGLLHALQSEICMFVAAAVVYLIVSSRLPSTAKRTPKGISKKGLDESSGDEEASKAKKMQARRAAGSTAPGASRRAAGNAAEQEALHLERNAKSIREFGKAGNLQAAIDAFASIKLGCSTMSSSLAHNSVIDACVQCTEMPMALKYLAEVKELGLADVVSYNTIIKGLLSSGDMDAVNGLLTEMAQHGVLASHVTFHSVLHVSVQSGDKDAAWRWLSQMRQAGLAPTSVTCSILLKLVTRPSHGADMSRVMSLVKEGDVQMDEVLLTSIVEASLKTQRLDLLAERLRECKDKGVLNRLSAPTYGAMIKAYGQAQNVDEVWTLWQEMIRCEVQPTMITLGCMVDALVMNGAVDSAWKLINSLWEQDSQKALLNTVIYSTVIKGFAISRRLDKAIQVYDEMQARAIPGNTITYNTLLNALVRCGDLRRLPQLLEDMRAASPPVEPDMITYSTIMKGYCSSGDLDKGLELLRDMEGSGQFAPDEVMYNSLLEGCAKEQRLEDALTLLQKMQAAGVAQSNYTLSIMIKLLGRARHLPKAFEMLQTAKANGVRPNIQVYTCLMQACFHNRQLKRALSVHDECVDDGCVLDQKAYDSLVRGCVQANSLEVAAEVVRCASGLQGHSLRRAKTAPQGVDGRTLQEVLKKLDLAGKKQVAQQLSEDLEAAEKGLPGNARVQKGGNGGATPAPWRRQA